MHINVVIGGIGMIGIAVAVSKFHVKKGIENGGFLFFKKRNAGGMFPFFELRPIRQKIVDIASPVHSLHTMNRLHMTTKKKISCKDRPECWVEREQFLYPFAIM